MNSSKHGDHTAYLTNCTQGLNGRLLLRTPSLRSITWEWYRP